MNTTVRPAQNPDKTTLASGSSTTISNQPPPPGPGPSGSPTDPAAFSKMPPVGSCEDVYLQPNYTWGSAVQRLNVSGQILNVSCRYDDPSVCNLPLLKAFANTMRLNVDGNVKTNVSGAPPPFMRWQLNAGEAMPNSTVINVTFFGTVQIRQVMLGCIRTLIIVRKLSLTKIVLNTIR